MTFETQTSGAVLGFYLLLMAQKIWPPWVGSFLVTTGCRTPRDRPLLGADELQPTPPPLTPHSFILPHVGRALKGLEPRRTLSAVQLSIWWWPGRGMKGRGRDGPCGPMRAAGSRARAWSGAVGGQRLGGMRIRATSRLFCPDVGATVIYLLH